MILRKLNRDMHREFFGELGEEAVDASAKSC